MRLTTELLQAAPSYLNPLNDRELDLRGHKILAIENLGVAGLAPYLRENYRYWVIWRCPSVRFLDYRKVKDVEKAAAGRLFGSMGEPSALAARIMGTKSKTFDISEPLNGGQKEYTVRLSAAEKKGIEARIRAAKSLEEVARLERELREGPQSLGDAMEE
ncbi:hypothetical protein C7212DRAFT_201685 [Tuber magnatum]|uniref:Uncharacterized protein n=1 Tax=Tuber magnatum TaxID=42249 RepID=A0A317SMU9_9PEZI|nr:hypothetical protein C7212DRAFT_201685 [Tuber magnatum]